MGKAVGEPAVRPPQSRKFAARGVIGTGQREDVATQPIEQGAHIRSQIDGLGLGLGGKAKLFGKALFARQRVSAWSLPAVRAFWAFWLL